LKEKKRRRKELKCLKSMGAVASEGRLGGQGEKLEGKR